jgi:hypothetical protein
MKTSKVVASFDTTDDKINYYCGSCKKRIKLVNGICPKCHSDYAATMEVFSIPIPKKGRK